MINHFLFPKLFYSHFKGKLLLNLLQISQAITGKPNAAVEEEA